MNAAETDSVQEALLPVDADGIDIGIDIDITFAPMGAADIDAVLAIEREIQSFPWSRGNFSGSLASGHAGWVMRRAGETIGFAVTMLACDESELLNIGVARQYQGQGLGSYFLECLFTEARRRGAKRMFLEVRASNAAALALYRRGGFVHSGLRAGYYPAAEGREDALVLEKKL